MTPGQLLARLHEWQIRLHVEGAFLQYEAPIGVFTEEYRAWVRFHQQALMTDWACKKCQAISRMLYGIGDDRLCRPCHKEAG